MLIAPDRLRQRIEAILQAAGSSAEEAQIVAAHLVRANLTGHDSHGVGMLPVYIKSLDIGALVPNAVLETTRDAGQFLQFNAQRGYGQRMAREAMEIAIARCRETGLVIMGLSNAHHIGRVGDYAEQSLKAGLVSLQFVNVIDHRPLVAPHRGTDARYSTNPLCFALPASARHPAILLDMATSKVALGKVRVALHKRQSLPEGTLFDGRGQPTTDPAVMFSEPLGAITPLGEHKGYGLALICELLAGGLTGGGTIQPDNERRGGIVNNLLTILIDPQQLVDLPWLQQETDKVLAYIKASPAANQAEPVLVPGEPERLSLEQRSQQGLPIDPTTWTQLEEIAAALGIACPEGGT
jgi:hydroxycarboxylate dehydrogenase B